ncbi:MAG: DUF642 domain-containing protein [Telmatospirillum sp.]|nr:DUF642 domain-containing protein [Telmatospirillum sp.]
MIFLLIKMVTKVNNFSKGAWFISIIMLLPLISFRANASLVKDGDFSGQGQATFYSGSSFGPWSVTKGSVDVLQNYWQAPPVGGGSVDLDGWVPGGIAQNLILPVGEYTLSFFLSGNPYNHSEKHLKVSVGNAVQEFSFKSANNTPSSMQFALQQFRFWANGSTVLNFESLDPSSSSWGPVVGGISISRAAVPEPSAGVMLGSGFLILGFLNLIRRIKRLKIKAV